MRKLGPFGRTRHGLLRRIRHGVVGRRKHWPFRSRSGTSLKEPAAKLCDDGEFVTTRKEFACKSIAKRKLIPDDDVEDVRRKLKLCIICPYICIVAG
ncbi:hypothetical protein Tco_0983164 [Tanacetum coccineum]